jgi:hypothetical protein
LQLLGVTLEFTSFHRHWVSITLYDDIDRLLYVVSDDRTPAVAFNLGTAAAAAWGHMIVCTMKAQRCGLRIQKQHGQKEWLRALLETCWW